MSTYEAAIQPLLDAYETLGNAVAVAESELAVLRAQRNQLRAAVKAVAPERLPEEKKKDKRREDRTRFSVASVQYVTEYLRDNMNGIEFMPSHLIQRPDWQGVGQSSIAPILRQLHGDGLVRLVRTGRGGSRYYEVIR